MNFKNVLILLAGVLLGILGCAMFSIAFDDEMQVKDWLPPFIPVGAIVVAVIAIHFQNKNARRQVAVNKLEELYEAIQSLSSYYWKMELLHVKINTLRSTEKKAFEWLSDYLLFRDQYIPEPDRMHINSLLTRIEVLANCYTSDNLQSDILWYQELLYWFSDKAFDGSSMNDMLVNKMIFPKQQEFMEQVDDLKKGILKEIKR
jgi:hypothetical protein